VSADPRVLSERYRVDELIGRGGMASVYRGQDLTLGRQVAIKILKRSSPPTARSAPVPARGAVGLAHVAPAIVRVYDAGEDAETDPTARRIPCRTSSWSSWRAPC
jgi:serine/threonine-protein kinase